MGTPSLSSTLICLVSAASVLGFDLCKKCKRIDLDTILQTKHLTRVGKPVRMLGPTKGWSPDSCSLCKLLLQIVPAQVDSSKNYELRCLSSNKMPERGLKAIDTTMLTIGGRGPAYLLKQPEMQPVVRIIQPNVDPFLFKNWLEYCQENHSSACSAGDTLLFDATTSPLSVIVSFKVIDCETQQIVSGCNTRYVALSYVWGAGEIGPKFSWALPHQLPETIKDAIAITKALGMRYLWIDRYCINQSKRSEVEEQVQRMDLIYSTAWLTIIAAAGETPNHGLPGVGNRRRQPQPQGIIRGHMLVSALPDPVHEIEQCKWFQRGWTYQEGLLSPRRLVFTDRQVYFECSGMYCCEALNLPLKNLHTQDGHRFKAEFCGKFNIGMFPRGIGTSTWEIVQRIEEYTKRQLTNPSDILKGISGILHVFKDSKTRVLHCGGLPMIPAAQHSKRRMKSELERQPRWSPFVGFCGGLCWMTISPSVRRKDFPSWSWTGWRGEIRWGIGEIFWPLEPNMDLQLSVQLKSGRVVDLETFCNSYDEMSMEVSDKLHVASWTFALKIRGGRKSLSDFKYEATVELEDKGPSVWTFMPTGTTSLLPDTECVGIHICHSPEGQSMRSLYVLVVQEVTEGVYERVGFGKMDGNIETVSEHEKGEWNGLLTEAPLPVPKNRWRKFQLC